MSPKLLFVPLMLATAIALANDVSEAERVADATEAQTQTEEGVTAVAPAEDLAEGAAAEAQAREEAPGAEEAVNDTGVQEGTEDDPKLISGMSVLGNREAPKSLVIVPWKSSQIGESIGISAMLDDSRQPVDREVFLRALTYYEIRSETRR